MVEVEERKHRAKPFQLFLGFGEGTTAVDAGDSGVTIEEPSEGSVEAGGIRDWGLVLAGGIRSCRSALEGKVADDLW